jgi:hypothetical protein
LAATNLKSQLKSFAAQEHQTSRFKEQAPLYTSPATATNRRSANPRENYKKKNK